ncbi:trigger factor [Phycicoccus endophyticus]|uniref:Trigger factor n=1 Tax=Phycicoccus endophyticus TaxID=1690220 RepID=A0A7G9R3K7_9MICO|nr:trigger factor [Phycicoccus endophyticus]NHI19939.1 trigger factor [Phycicoccus endophyticus]QNN50182.1 trigger factor [Phycicoccus endophyticus]GGL27315.1 trigger factor [Phycicoccus endophyticus]
MKSAVETLSPTRVKLTVEVPFEELKPLLEDAYRSIGSQVQVPGFRRGKVPARIIDQRIGRGAVVQEAVNEALPKYFAEAAEAEDVRAIGQPEVDVTAVPLEDGQDLEFTVETDVRPTLELPELTGVAVSVDDVAVTDEDVEERLTALRERFGTLVGVDRAVEDGDHVSIDLSAEIDGEQIDAVEGVSYEVGSGNMLQGIDEALLGLSAGETATFTAPLAGGDHEGQEAECTVTVQSVKVRELPELDDEFAQLASEFDTLEELRADLVRQAEQAKKYEQGIQARDRLLEQLLETVEVPVPDGIVEAEVHSHLEGENRLEDDEHRAEVEESTRKALRAQFLLDALAEQLEVTVEQPELIEYLVMSAQQYGMDPNQFAQAVDQQGQVSAMVQEVARRKALAAVLDDAVVTDASGNPVDLDELVPESETAAAGEEGTAEEAATGEEPAAAAEAQEGAQAEEPAQA